MSMNIPSPFQQGKYEGFDSCDWPSNHTQIGFKSLIFQPMWPWNLMDDLEKLQGTSSTLHQALFIISNPSVNSNWSYCPETLNSGQNQRFIVPFDLEIWWMTLKNNRASLLCYIKLCASFHQLIQTGVTVRYSPERPNLGQNQQIFIAVWPWNSKDDLEKQ